MGVENKYKQNGIETQEKSKPAETVLTEEEKAKQEEEHQKLANSFSDLTSAGFNLLPSDQQERAYRLTSYPSYIGTGLIGQIAADVLSGRSTREVAEMHNLQTSQVSESLWVVQSIAKRFHEMTYPSNGNSQELPQNEEVELKPSE